MRSCRTMPSGVPPLPSAAIPVPQAALDAGVSEGSLDRLRAMVGALCRREPIAVAAVGCSSTAGHGFERNSPKLYHARLCSWLNRTSPNARHELVNSGVPATGPEYMEKCFNYQMPERPDVVFVEYAQNIAQPSDELALERLLRSLLRHPSRPAVRAQ